MHDTYSDIFDLRTFRTYTAPNCWVITPSASDFISSVTLSVSTNATTSPSFTAWPIRVVHSTIVPCEYCVHLSVRVNELKRDNEQSSMSTNRRMSNIDRTASHVKSHNDFTSVIESPMVGTFNILFSSSGSVAEAMFRRLRRATARSPAESAILEDIKEIDARESVVVYFA